MTPSMIHKGNIYVPNIIYTGGIAIAIIDVTPDSPECVITFGHKYHICGTVKLIWDITTAVIITSYYLIYKRAALQRKKNPQNTWNTWNTLISVFAIAVDILVV